MKDEKKYRELEYVTDCLLYVALWLSELDDVTDPIERARLEKGILDRIKRNTTREFRNDVFVDLYSQALEASGALD